MQFVLHKEELVVIDGDARKLSVFCLGGTIWITQPQDRDDHVIKNGQLFTIDRKGKVTLRALQDACFTVFKWSRTPSKWSLIYHSN